jgi:hypothetical protein
VTLHIDEIVELTIHEWKGPNNEGLVSPIFGGFEGWVHGTLISRSETPG